MIRVIAPSLRFDDYETSWADSQVQGGALFNEIADKDNTAAYPEYLFGYARKNIRIPQSHSRP